MEIEVGIQKSKIVTDNPKLLKALVDLYSFKVKGAEYTTAYRRRAWDGKKKFITPAGYFRTGLLTSLLIDLAKVECDPTLNYKFKINGKWESWDIEGFKLRDYQEEAVIHSLRESRCVIKAPTGAGKTIIMAALVKALEGRKMVLMFNSKQLISDAYEFLTKSCGIENVGINFGDGYIYGDIMLTTVQSIDKILDTHLEEAEVLMVDEAHEFCNGETTTAAIESFPNAGYRYAFTATPPVENIPKMTLEGAFGSIYTVRTVTDLIDEGFLTKPIIHMHTLPDSKEGGYEGLSYRDMYDELIVNNDHRNEKIVEIVNEIEETNDKARVLILVSRLEHGELLLRSLGARAQYIHGSDDLVSRYNAIREFTVSESTSVLIGSKILQTGVDICEITHIINARGLKSPIATIQALGRALRLHDTKSVVQAYDFLDQGKYLYAHARKRLNTYKKEGHEVIIHEE
jgi:superfamily II DNA or RNA helicase